jgi:glycine dehydrogenase
MGPIGVKKHLIPFLSNNPFVPSGGEKSYGAISSAPYGSPPVLAIAYMYITGLGKSGITQATEV